MKPIRVALSGSGFKFPAHVGALAAVQDAGFDIVEFAGTSGGSIIASLAACGMSVQDMKDITLSRDWSDMLSFSLWSSMTNMGYCSGTALFDWLQSYTKGKVFADLPFNLTVVASDVVTEKPFVFSKETTPHCPVALAARASASIPFVYSPVQFNGALLMDGGMVNNIPIDKLDIDSVPRLGVQLLSKVSTLQAGSYSVLDILPRILNLMMSANENTHIDMAEMTNARIAFVETGYASSLDRNMSREVRQRLMEDGYKSTMDVLSRI